jgi:hypothetical protein
MRLNWRLLPPPVQAQILAGVDAEGVVGALLWAQRFVDASNGAFAGLLSRLKEWYTEHEEDVSDEAAARLMAEAPLLACSLYRRKRQRP